jgi:uncharacterized repeat protein (TIGR03803 family)
MDKYSSFMKPKAEFKNRSWMQFKNFIAVQSGLVVLCLAVANSPAQTYTVLHHFTGSDGADPMSLALSGATLYGTTGNGGSFNCGAVFKLNTDGSDFTVLKQFAGSDGADPGGLALSGATVYGRTYSGGHSNLGTVFKLNTDGSGFTVLKEFDSAEPHSLLLSDTALYGTTYNGGISNRGTVFKLNTDGGDFTVIKEFTDPPEGGAGAVDGCLPNGCLALSGTTLYGATVGGGVSGAGVVFKVNTDGSGYTVLKQGNFSDGGHFSTGVILSGTTLYGTTPWGGGGAGAVFKLNTDGSGYRVLKSFNVYDGYMPTSLVLSGSKLFGTAPGFTNSGVVFMLDTEGSHFTLVKQFNGTDGSGPGGLVVSGTTLYGTTSSGGNSNRGTVFGLSIAPPTVLMPPVSQTAELGSSVGFGLHTASSSPLSYQWFFNGTNAVSNATTNSGPVLTNVQFSYAGGYSVVVSNIFGSVTSAPAMLNVIAAVERRPVPGVKVTGETGSGLNVDYANSLSSAPNWTTLGSVSLTSTSQFYFDLTAPLPPQRFYRAWQTGTPSVVPSLNLNFVPAITLTGNVGDSLRLDYINAIGPTDAWVTLDTVTLTNTSQLYFDIWASGQPVRLYRIVPVP